MKRVSGIIVALLICLSSLGLNQVTAEAANKYQYTLMIYMNGSDLESESYAATEDLLEMIRADFNDTVAVIIETGGTNDWHTDEVGLTSVSSTKSQRFLVKENDIEEIDSDLIKNMGDASTLEDFIVYGMERYSANQYGLIMWNHGSGSITGFGADELYSYDSLTIEEMDNAFSGAYGITGQKFDFVGFDACLMGAVEVAEMLAPYSNYLLASEEYEPGHGWDYETVVSAIHSGKSGEALGKAIIDGYVAHSQANRTADTITASLVDLGEIEPVMEALEGLFSLALELLEDEESKRQIIHARLQAESYGEGSVVADDSDMVDILDYASYLPERFSEHQSALELAVNEAVVYNINSALKPKASGLAIYIPSAGEYGKQRATEVYDTMGFSNDYFRFLVRYMQVLTAGGNQDLSFDTSTESLGYDNYQEVTDMLDVNMLDADDYNFYMYLSPDQLDLIDEVKMVFGYEADLGDIVYLGKDIVGEDNILADGTIIGQTLDYWVTLEDFFVPMYYMGADDSGYLYYFIPIRINDNDYDLIVLFSEEIPTGTILGARPYNLHENGANIYSRELIMPQQGDFISLMYETDIYNGNYYYYDDWSVFERFRFDGILDFNWAVIPDGGYGYSFEIRDIYQDVYYTDWILYDYYDTYLLEQGYEMSLLWDALIEDTLADDTWTDDIWEEEKTDNGNQAVIEAGSDQPSDWALDYVVTSMDYGIATSDSLSGFQDDITRGEFCELVVEMYEVSTGVNVPVLDDSVFWDTDNAYAFKANQLGIVNGYLDGSFREDNSITRQELMTMFYRLLLALDVDVTEYYYSPLWFDDLDQLGSFAQIPTEFMVGEGLVNGTGDNMLNPLGTSTKEVTLKIAVGVFEYWLYN